MNFETTMDELKKRLDILEKGDLSLEQSMSAYEEGIKLVRHAEQTLSSMEGRMEEIMNDTTKQELDPKLIIEERHDNKA
jgi:exodeoxyribonuclease VII small subunit